MPQMPLAHDFTIIRGNTRPRPAWQMPIDIAGSEWVLTLKGDDFVIVKRSSDGGLITNVSDRIVMWPITVDESRQIPAGRLTSYELERHVPGEGNEQRTYVRGVITGRGGINDD